MNLAELERVRGAHLIVAVRNPMALRAGRLPADVLPFASGILLKDLLPRLEAFRSDGRPYNLHHAATST